MKTRELDVFREFLGMELAAASKSLFSYALGSTGPSDILMVKSAAVRVALIEQMVKDLGELDRDVDRFIDERMKES